MNRAIKMIRYSRMRLRLGAIFLFILYSSAASASNASGPLDATTPPHSKSRDGSASGWMTKAGGEFEDLFPCAEDCDLSRNNRFKIIHGEDHIRIDAKVVVQCYDVDNPDCIDRPVALGDVWKDAWNPRPFDYCNAPDRLSGDLEDRVGADDFVHLKLLTPDGRCMEFNSRLDLRQGQEPVGEKYLSIILPVDAPIDQTNVLFPSCSDFAHISIGRYWFEDFILQRGKSYRVLITRQVDLKTGATSDVEQPMLAAERLTVRPSNEAKIHCPTEASSFDK